MRVGTREVFKESTSTLELLGIKCGRDKFYDVLRAAGLLIRPKKTCVRTTDSSAWMRQFDDLRRELKPTGPDQLWSADIACEEQRLYLCLITDEYSRQISVQQAIQKYNEYRPHGALGMNNLVKYIRDSFNHRKAHQGRFKRRQPSLEQPPTTVK